MVNYRGVTLIELLIIVLILGALTSIALPRISMSRASAATAVCDTNAQIINDQLELYEHNKGTYPFSLNQLLRDTDYFPDGPPQCPVEERYRMSWSSKRIIKHTHSGGGRASRFGCSP